MEDGLQAAVDGRPEVAKEDLDGLAAADGHQAALDGLVAVAGLLAVVAATAVAKDGLREVAKVGPLVAPAVGPAAVDGLQVAPAGGLPPTADGLLVDLDGHQAVVGPLVAARAGLQAVPVVGPAAAAVDGPQVDPADGLLPAAGGHQEEVEADGGEVPTTCVLKIFLQLCDFYQFFTNCTYLPTYL